MNDLIINNNLTYNFNPFGGINESEIKEVLVPRKFIKDIIKDIENEQELIVELVGAQGRGKTSHLRLLHQLYPSSPIFLLNSKSDINIILSSKADLIFIDSIHHINLIQRIKLFRSKKKIILTSHFTKFLEFTIANKKYKRYLFKGIDEGTLCEIIKKRIELAITQKEDIKINKKRVINLINKYGDNHRSIINHLYDTFKF